MMAILNPMTANHPVYQAFIKAGANPDIDLNGKKPPIS